MTIAEIHGKISGSGSNLSDRLEDLLTSDVFGPLRYLPFADGLQRILREARTIHGKQLIVGEPKYTSLVCFWRKSHFRPEVHFWPKLQNSGLNVVTEPDVLIECGDHLVLVEAKYLSGKSGAYDEENPKSAEWDQLAREFCELMDYDRDRFSERSLVYLTAHRTMPKSDIENSYNAVCKKHPEYMENTYWLSWFDIHRVIDDEIQRMSENHTAEQASKKLILGDIKSLLYKKGFRDFKGFSGLELQEVDAISGKVFYQRVT